MRVSPGPQPKPPLTSSVIATTARSGLEHRRESPEGSPARAGSGDLGFRSAAAGGGDDPAEGGEVFVTLLRRDPLPGARAAAVRVAQERVLLVMPPPEAGG